MDNNEMIDKQQNSSLIYEDKSILGWQLLAFFIPISGVIMFLNNRKNHPAKASRYIRLAVIGALIFLPAAYLGVNKSFKQNHKLGEYITDSKTKTSTDVPGPDSSGEEGDFMLRLIQGEVKLPIDSATAVECNELMKNSLSLSDKLIDAKLGDSPEGGKAIGMTMLILLRGSELLDSSKNVMDKKMWKDYVDLKPTYDERILELNLIYQNYLKIQD